MGLEACSCIAISSNVPNARWPQALGVGEGGMVPQFPAAGKGHKARSACWVAGCTLGLHGDASAVPTLLAPHAHQCPVICSRWSLSWSQPRTLMLWPGQSLVLLLPGTREGGKSELSSG